MSSNRNIVSKSNKLLLELPKGECFVRQRNVSMDEYCDQELNEENLQKAKPKLKRSDSLDSGVCLTPPSSPLICTQFAVPCASMYSQQGPSLAVSFLLEQEMGLCKLKLE